MDRVLKVTAVLFFILAAAAIWDGFSRVLAFREFQSTGGDIPTAELPVIIRNLVFTWVFAAIYGSIGMGFWVRRKLNYILILLFASLVGQWMNVGYRNGFVLSFAALILLAVPSVRARFRN